MSDLTAADVSSDIEGPRVSAVGSVASGRNASGAGADSNLPAAGATPVELSPELHSLLTEFGAALRKYAMYPPSHPALGPALDTLHEQIARRLVQRARLAINIGRDRLMIENAVTDTSNLLVQGLALRLHGHQLVTLTFRAGVDHEELAGLLAALSREPQLEGQPLGREPEEVLKRWSHILLEPLRYDPLTLAGAETPDAVGGGKGPWFGSLPFSTEIAGADLLNTDASEVADRIEERLGDDPVERMIAVQLFRLAENLVGAEGEASDLLRSRMSELVFCLEPKSLAHLVNVSREGGRLNGFLRDASQWMEADAIVELIRVAAEGQKDVVAPWLIRIMSKMAMYVGSSSAQSAAESQDAMRSVIDRMLSEWAIEDPRSADYSDTLRRVARRTPGAQTHAHPSTHGSAPEHAAESVELARIVETSLELDEPSEIVRRAAQRMVGRGDAALLLDILEEAPEGSRVADLLWQRISTPDAFVQLLNVEPPNFEALDRIIARLGVDAASAMLEVLTTSKSRFVRRQLFDRLPPLGPDIVPLVIPRLADARWYVVRNMLALLREFAVWPRNFDPTPYYEHPEARVRIEALRLALAWPDRRDEAVCRALKDLDRRILSLGLGKAEESCPAAAEQLLIVCVRDRQQAPEIRSAAVRCLASLGSPRAITTLTGLCVQRRWFFWKQLAPVSPAVLEALRAMAWRWPEERGSATILRLAADSANAEVREALRALSTSEPEPATDGGTADRTTE